MLIRGYVKARFRRWLKINEKFTSLSKTEFQTEGKSQSDNLNNGKLMIISRGKLVTNGVKENYYESLFTDRVLTISRLKTDR